jgi:serine protease Do
MTETSNVTNTLADGAENRRGALGAIRGISMLAALFLFATVLAPGAADAKAAPESFADLAEKLLPSVVNISTTQAVEGRRLPEMPQVPPGSPFEEFFKDFFDRNQPQRRRKATSLGSGFVIDKAGYVITNNHVIADADEITVILQDDTRLKAKLVGRDPRTDLAVLKVEPTTALVPTTFGDSTVTRVGDWIVAIGNPFGLGGTVTAGIISARGRDIQAGPYDDFLQTDASINRGNSGGPMFNMKGEVIGINTAIISPSGGSIGIGFAIPSSTAKPVIEQLIKHGEVRRGWLGVHIQQVTDEIAETLGLKEASGALVASVMKDGPAEAAGLKAGDIILEFAGKKVTQMRELPRIVAATEIGKPVNVVVWRDGKRVSEKVTVGELDDEKIQMSSRGSGGGDKGEVKIDSLGLTLSALNDAVRKRFDLGDEVKGVVVTAVEEDATAAEKGIRPGDVIVEAQQQEVASPGDVIRMVREARKAKKRSILLRIEGKGGLRFDTLPIEAG